MPCTTVSSRTHPTVYTDEAHTIKTSKLPTQKSDVIKIDCARRRTVYAESATHVAAGTRMKRGIDSLVEASANLLLLSWTVWITAAVIFNLVKPWQSYLPVVLSDMLTYGKLKDDSLLPSPVDSSSPISRLVCE